MGQVEQSSDDSNVTSSDRELQSEPEPTIYSSYQDTQAEIAQDNSSINLDAKFATASSVVYTSLDEDCENRDVSNSFSNNGPTDDPQWEFGTPGISYPEIVAQIAETEALNSIPVQPGDWLETSNCFTGSALETIPENQALDNTSYPSDVVGSSSSINGSSQYPKESYRPLDFIPEDGGAVNHVTDDARYQNISYYADKDENTPAEVVPISYDSSQVIDSTSSTNGVHCDKNLFSASLAPQAAIPPAPVLLQHHFLAVDHRSTFGRSGLYKPRDVQDRMLSQNKLPNSDRDVKDEGVGEDSSKDDDGIHQKHKDVDGGWAWAVLFMAFLTQFIVIGVLFSFNLYFLPLTTEFGTSKSQAALVGALANGFLMVGSVVSNKVIAAYGCRLTVIVGVVLMEAGFILSYFAPNIHFVCLFIGVVCAVGMNMCYLSTVLILAQYFLDRHHLAISLSMTGAGVGMFVLNALFNYIIEVYGLSGALLSSAVICLCLLPVAWVYRPLPLEALLCDYDISHQSADGELDLERTASHLNRHTLYQRHLDNKSFSSFMMAPQGSYMSESLYSLNSLASGGSVSARRARATAAINNSYIRAASRGTLHNQHGACDNNSSASKLPYSRRYSQLSVSSKAPSTHITNRSPSKGSLPDSRLDLLLHGLRSNSQSFSWRHPEEDGAALIDKHKLDSLVEEEKQSRSSSEGDDNREPDECVHKKASFMINIGDSDDEDAESNASDDNYGEDDGYICQDYLKKITSIEISPILKDTSLWLFTWANFFCLLGTATLYIVFEDFCRERNMLSHCALAQQLAGVGDMLGRLSAGLLSDRNWGDSTVLHAMAMFTSSVLLLLFLYIDVPEVFVSVAFFYGYMFGTENTYVAINANVLFGKEFLHIVMTANTFIPGVGYFMGSPSAGAIAEASGSYTLVILASVGCCLISGTLAMSNVWLRRHRAKQEDGKAKQHREEQKHIEEPDAHEKIERPPNVRPYLSSNLRFASSHADDMGSHRLNHKMGTSNAFGLERRIFLKNMQENSLRNVRTEEELHALPSSRQRSDSVSSTARRAWMMPRNSTCANFQGNRRMSDLNIDQQDATKESSAVC